MVCYAMEQWSGQAEGMKLDVAGKKMLMTEHQKQQ